MKRSRVRQILGEAGAVAVLLVAAAVAVNTLSRTHGSPAVSGHQGIAKAASPTYSRSTDVLMDAATGSVLWSGSVPLSGGYAAVNATDGSVLWRSPIEP
jgi:hypothetical protein